MITWLASYPKSGNTWVRTLISAYHRGEVDINDLTGTMGDNLPYQTQIVSPLPLDKLTPDQFALLRPAALMHLIKQHRYEPRFVKTHCSNARVGSVDLIPEELTTKAVLIARDPRDVAVSLSRHLGIDVDTAIKNMACKSFALMQDGMPPALLGTWSEHTRSWMEASFDVLCLHYEKLKDDPSHLLTVTLAYAGMNPNQERVQRAVEMSRLENLKRQEDEKGFREASKKTDRFFGAGKGWETELTTEQLRRIEDDHHDVMTELGYELHSRSEVA